MPGAVEHAAEWGKARPGDPVATVCGLDAYLCSGLGAEEPWQVPWPFDPAQACLDCIRITTGGRL